MGPEESVTYLPDHLLGTGKPVLVRLLELVGIGGEFAETSPLVPSVPRDTRHKVTVVHVLLDIQ
jgi:hypothetical protein